MKNQRNFMREVSFSFAIHHGHINTIINPYRREHVAVKTYIDSGKKYEFTESQQAVLFTSEKPPTLKPGLA